MSIDTGSGPVAAVEHRSLREPTANARQRERFSKAMTVLLFLAVMSALIPLFSLMTVVVVNGAPAFGWEFITQVEPLSYRDRGGGYLHGIVGTLYMTGIATLFSVPLGLAAAVYLNENPGRRYTQIVRFFTDVMTGVPSIFVGLAVYALMVSGSGGFGLGFGTLAGAIALAIIMLPIVVRSSEEMLRLVPNDLKAASYGLGARQWQTTFKVTLPAAAPGLTTGCILAVARGAGETAPLIMTAFGARQVVTSLVGEAQSDVGLLMLGRFPATLRGRYRTGLGRWFHTHRDRADPVDHRASLRGGASFAR
jgi:phosphate transport system permease protein